MISKPADLAPRADPGGVLIMVVAASLFATLGPLSRTAYGLGLEPFAFVAWRAAIGGIGLGAAVILVRSRRQSMLPWSRMSGSTRQSLGLAILLGAALNLFIFFAFDRTTIALALLALYTYPAMVAAASVALGRERLDTPRALALVLALAGMVAVVLGGLGAESALRIDPLGIAAALAAAGCQAAFVLTSRGYASVPSDQAMASILAGTGVVAAVVTIASGGPAALLQPLGNGQLLALLLVVGIFAAALPSFIFLTGMRRLGGIRTGIVMLAEPVVAVTLAAIFLSEPVAPLQAVGGVTILVAAILVQRDSPSEAVVAVAPVPGGP
jgi:drug/metabolite transporter (DMT)-like permease